MTAVNYMILYRIFKTASWGKKFKTKKQIEHGTSKTEQDSYIYQHQYLKDQGMLKHNIFTLYEKKMAWKYNINR